MREVSSDNHVHISILALALVTLLVFMPKLGKAEIISQQTPLNKSAARSEYMGPSILLGNGLSGPFSEMRVSMALQGWRTPPENAGWRIDCFTTSAYSSLCPVDFEWDGLVRLTDYNQADYSLLATDGDFQTGYPGGHPLVFNPAYYYQISNIGFNSFYYFGSAPSGGTLYYILAATSTISSSFVFNVSNNITATTTWESGNTYKISGNIAVNSGVTLTIEPGAIVKFDTATTSGLTVNGTLDAEWSSASTTFFTSLKDDLIGGDTNGDATSTSPAAGDWGGIKINSGGSATLDGAIIRYGGSATPLIFNNGGTVTVSTSTVAYSSTEGIRNDAGTTTVTASDLGFNTYGLYLNGGSISVSATSTIHDNSLYGAFNNTAATSSFFAENNYWATTTATTTGPYNATYNSSGVGNAVSDFVDFDPWVGKNGSSSLPHYIIGASAVAPGSCELPYNASTAYSSELSAAVTTWNAENGVTLTPATTTSVWNLDIADANRPDMIWKGKTDLQLGISNSTTTLNSYYLDQNSSDEVQNTIAHELGHALGLDHSYTGNIMYFLQSHQTALGAQDHSDYEYIWDGVCI